MKINQLATSLICLVAVSAASAQEWVDTGEADDLLSYGVRVGFNTSNATRTKNGSVANLDAWGTGFNAGVVVNLNINNALSLQPGFFFQSRSHDYSYVLDYPEEAMPNVQEKGNRVRPYFNFGLSGSDKGTQEIGTALREYSDGYFDNRKKFDFGFKMGTGLQVFDHYYLGIHYEAGACKVWKHYNGHNKAWSFTLGYNF